MYSNRKSLDNLEVASLNALRFFAPTSIVNTFSILKMYDKLSIGERINAISAVYRTYKLSLKDDGLGNNEFSELEKTALSEGMPAELLVGLRSAFLDPTSYYLDSTAYNRALNHVYKSFYLQKDNYTISKKQSFADRIQNFFKSIRDRFNY